MNAFVSRGLAAALVVLTGLAAAQGTGNANTGGDPSNPNSTAGPATPGQASASGSSSGGGNAAAAQPKSHAPKHVRPSKASPAASAASN